MAALLRLQCDGCHAVRRSGRKCALSSVLVAKIARPELAGLRRLREAERAVDERGFGERRIHEAALIEAAVREARRGEIGAIESAGRERAGDERRVGEVGFGPRLRGQVLIGESLHAQR